MPRYNILLKDDKGYPSSACPKRLPRFSLVNKMANDSARYFGPFGGRFETRQALDAVCVALRLPTCSRKFPRDIGAEAPLSELPHGPVRRILPAGDDSRSV